MTPYPVPIGWVGLVLGLLYLLYLFRSRRGLGYTATSALVIDGDTIVVDRKRIRLHGIDAPELSQRGGSEARAHLTLLIGEGFIHVTPITKDKYGRTVARVSGVRGDLCRLMVLNGFAIAAFGRDYTDEERRSRSERRGLWATGGIKCPSDHRAKTKKGRGWT